MAILLCSAETVDERPTYTWLKDTTIGCSTAVETSDLNSQDCGNAVPNQPCQLFQPLFSHHCHVMVISKDGVLICLVGE